MPYMKKNENGRVKVYKKGPDGQPTGDSLGTHDSEEKADKQIAALYTNEKQLDDINARIAALIAPDIQAEIRAASSNVGSAPNSGSTVSKTETVGSAPASAAPATAPAKPAATTTPPPKGKKTRKGRGPKKIKGAKAPKTRKTRKTASPKQRKTTGRPVGHPPGLANVKEAGDVTMDQSEKSYTGLDIDGDGDNDDFYSDIGKLEQDDPRVNYDPIGGLKSGGKACANCTWYRRGLLFGNGAGCQVVEGEIEPTGLSDLWMAIEEEEDEDEPEPMPVFIVGQEQKSIETPAPVSNVETGEKDKKFANPKNDNHPDRLPLGNKAQIEGAITSVVTGQFRGNKLTPALTPEEKKTAEGHIMSAINASGESDDWKKQEKDRLKGKSDKGSKSLWQTVKSWFTPDQIDFTVEAGFKALPDRKWVAWWTNNFQDGHKEIFRESAINRFIDRVEKEVLPYPELWWRHLPVPSGKATWLGQVDHLTLAAGDFYDTKVGDQFYQHYKSIEEPYAVSHGFLFLRGQRKDGVYDDFYTYEISPLYQGEEANPITGFGVKEMSSTITEEKKKALEAIIGPEMATAYLQFGEQKSKELEAVGLKFKEQGDPAPASTTPAISTDPIQIGQKELVEAFKQVGELMTEQKTAIEKLTETVTKQGATITTLQSFIKEQSELAPRASKSPQTKLDLDNPLLQYMAKKELEQDSKAQNAEPNALSIIMNTIAHNPGA